MANGRPGLESAVASFFQPTSQKPKERTSWSERAPDDDTPATLLVGRYEPEGMGDADGAKRGKIAAFDLVSLACLFVVPEYMLMPGSPSYRIPPSSLHRRAKNTAITRATGSGGTLQFLRGSSRCTPKRTTASSS